MDRANKNAQGLEIKLYEDRLKKLVSLALIGGYFSKNLKYILLEDDQDLFTQNFRLFHWLSVIEIQY